MNNKEIKILLVGVGGYGGNCVNALLDDVKDYNINIAGAVDPFPSKGAERLKNERNVPFYNSMDDFYKENKAELCVISTPIHFHKSQVLCALKNGSNVLCEKPGAGCAKDIEEMISAQNNSNRFAAIGFQFSFDDAVLQFKKDVISGIWGKPILYKSISLLPRSRGYFKDRGWAGKMYDNQGNIINDNIANNAAAHALHNLLFIAGDNINSSASPVSCEAKLIRANEIETYDAVSAKFILHNEIRIYFNAAHPVKKSTPHTFEFQFEGGIVKWTYGEQLEGTFNDGTIKKYGVVGDFLCKLEKSLKAIATGENCITCDVNTVLPHAQAVELLEQYVPYILKPVELKSFTSQNNDEIYYVSGLDDELINCYEENRLLLFRSCC